MVTFTVAACSPGGDSNPEAPVTQDSQLQTAPITTSACEGLADLQLADTTVSEAVELKVSERQTLAQSPRLVRLDVPHCKVTGVIDSTINFELLLPDAWNGKFLMGGGGGFVGSVQNQAQDGLMYSGLTPLERGYATVGTDTGHTGSGIDASWALNDQKARENFAHRAVHRTAEVSKKIITEYYGESIDNSYFFGCSRGGGQAMISAQRYPEDFDGIIAGAPAIDWTGIGAGFVRNQQFVFPDPDLVESPVITAANRALLAESLRASCDEIDGLADGIINDPRACTFDPAELPRCEADPGAHCVTDTQLAAIQTIYTGPNIDGDQLHPGFPYGGENDPAGWEAWITRANPSIFTLPPGIPNLHFALGTELLKYFIFNDPAWNYAGYDFEDYREVSAETAALLNATDPDLSRLRDGGGKLILWHGWSDAALTAVDSIDYYASVEQRDPALRDYFRMYLMPGVGHCNGGPGPDRADWITAIERWVENDVPPEQLIASKSDEQGKQIMARPICPYPQSARYDGSGDPDVSESYSCTSALSR